MQIDQLIELVQNALSSVRKNEFEEQKANAIAGAALEVQLKLADYLAEAELQAKNAKNVLDLTIAETAADIRANAESKVSEAFIDKSLNKEQKVVDAKKLVAENEKIFKKYQYIFNTMKDAHIFFRNLNKVV